MLSSHVERHNFLKEKKKRVYNTVTQDREINHSFHFKNKKIKIYRKGRVFFQDVLDFLSCVLALSIDALNQICYHAESVFLLFPFLKKEKNLSK
jgi:hypothetical protein